MRTTKIEIKKFIVDGLITESGVSKLGDEDDLLISNMLDSLGVMRLVEYLERVNGMKIPAEDITLDNFQTVNKIVDYLSAQCGHTTSAGGDHKPPALLDDSG